MTFHNESLIGAIKSFTTFSHWFISPSIPVFLVHRCHLEDNFFPLHTHHILNPYLAGIVGYCVNLVLPQYGNNCTSTDKFSVGFYFFNELWSSIVHISRIAVAVAYWRRFIRVFWFEIRKNLRIFHNRFTFMLARYKGYEFAFHISKVWSLFEMLKPEEINIPKNVSNSSSP